MTDTLEAFIPDEQQRADIIHLLKNPITDDDQTVYIHVHGGAETARATLITAIQDALGEIWSKTTTSAFGLQKLHRPAVKGFFEVLGALKGWVYITPSEDVYLKHAEKNLDYWRTQVRIIAITCGRKETEKQRLVNEIRSQMV